jgi:transposase
MIWYNFEGADPDFKKIKYFRSINQNFDLMEHKATGNY